MGIKKRIMTSGIKFVKKHQSLYEKLVKKADGPLATDDDVQLAAAITAISLSEGVDGEITATVTVRGDLEQAAQGDTFKVTTVGASGTDTFTGVHLEVSEVDGIPGIDSDIELKWTASANEEISVTAVILRDGVELEDSTSPVATIEVTTVP